MEYGVDEEWMFEEWMYIEEENVYCNAGRERLLDSEGMSAEEEGFMSGYEDIEFVE